MALAWVLPFFLALPAGTPCSRTALPSPVRGATMVHLDDRADADPTNDGTRGYGTEAARRMLAHLKAQQLNMVSLISVGHLENLTATTVSDERSQPAGTSDARLLQVMADARAAGLRIMLVPHLHLPHGQWRGNIVLNDAKKADAFFKSYGAFLEHAARVAELGCADVLSLGVELKGLSGAAEHDARWAALVKRVRRVFRGTLTYSANWDELPKVRFLKLLDVAGVNAFFPLHKTPRPDDTTLATGGRSVLALLDAMHRRHGRKVLLTEFGFKSVEDSGIRPWEWPEDVKADARPQSQRYQARAYRALLCALHGAPSFAGAVVWFYPSDAEDVRHPARWEGPNGFSPLGKEAERVLREFCASQPAPSNDVRSPSSGRAGRHSPDHPG